jgi:hypothetical protein
MTKNIEDLLYRGDSLERMGDISSRLREDSRKYKKAAVRINWELLLKQVGQDGPSKGRMLTVSSMVPLEVLLLSSSSSSGGGFSRCMQVSKTAGWSLSERQPAYKCHGVGRRTRPWRRSIIPNSTRCIMPPWLQHDHKTQGALISPTRGAHAACMLTWCLATPVRTLMLYTTSRSSIVYSRTHQLVVGLTINVQVVKLQQQHPTFFYP